MEQEKPIVEDAVAIEDMHHLHLTVLLKELLREHGKMATAGILGINYKTLIRGMRTDMPSPKLRWALERLQRGEGASAVIWQRERNHKLEDRLERLEEQFRGAVSDMKTAFGEFKEETAIQLAVVGLVREGVELSTSGDNEGEKFPESSGLPWWRPRGRRVLSPGTMDLIFAWRQALIRFVAAEERLRMALELGAESAPHGANAGEVPSRRRASRAVRSRRQLACSETDAGAETELG